MEAKKIKYGKCYQHKYYNKNCFPEHREILACKKCANKYDEPYRIIKLSEPAECFNCKRLIK